jgi:hypothetical protein
MLPVTPNYMYALRYEIKACNFFLDKCNCCNNDICIDDSQMFWNYQVIFSKILRHFQHSFAIFD